MQPEEIVKEANEQPAIYPNSCPKDRTNKHALNKISLKDIFCFNVILLVIMKSEIKFKAVQWKIAMLKWSGYLEIA